MVRWSRQFCWLDLSENHCIVYIFGIFVTWKSGTTYWWLDKSHCVAVCLPKPISVKLMEECGVVVDVCLSAGRLIPSAFRSMSQTLFFFLSGGPFSSTHAKWKMDQGSPRPLVYKKRSREPADRQRDEERRWWIRDTVRRRKRRKMQRTSKRGSLRRSAEFSRSQGRLLTLELWPIYWLALQGWLSQENNHAQFICITFTRNETKTKLLSSRFCKGKWAH